MSRLFVDIAKKLFLITILPLIILVIIYFFLLKSTYINNIEEFSHKNLVMLKGNIANHMEMIEKISSYALEMSKNTYEPLERVFDRFNEFYEMGVFLDGKPVFGISRNDFDPDSNMLMRDTEIFAKNGEYFILGRIKSSVNDAELRYTIAAKQFFQKFLASVSSDYNFFVLDKKGNIIFSGNRRPKDIEENIVYDIKSILSGNSESQRSVTISAKNAVVTFISPENFPFILGMGIHSNFIYSHAVANILNFGILVFILIVVELFITYVVARNIVKPINALTRLSANLENGSFKLNIIDIPDNEIGDLIINFQSAAERIKNLLEDKDAQHEEILTLYKNNKLQLTKLDSLFNSIIDGVYVVNSHMEITYINDAELDYLEKKREEVMGEKCYYVFYNRQSPCSHCPLLNSSSRKIFALHNIFLPELGRNDKERIYVNMFFVPFGEDEYIVSTHDITEINIAYNKLAEKENLLQKIFDTSSDPIFLKDTKGVYLQTNNAFDKIFSLPHNFAVGKTAYDIFPYETAKKIHESDMMTLQEKKADRIDEAFIRNGATIYLETVKVPLTDDNGRIIGILGIDRDITRRKYLEMRLQKERDKLLVTLRSIGDGVIVTDENAKVEMLNTVASQLIGFSEEEAAGKDINSVFNIVSEKTGEQMENPAKKCIKDQKICVLSNHTLLINKNGAEIVVADSAAPIIYNGNVIGSVLVFRDETERRYILEEIIKKQKLESVGVLAGGIAHDFNNILAALNTYLTLMEMDQEHNDSVRKYIDNMKNLMERAKFLSNQLLTFSKGGAPAKKPMDIYMLVKETADFVLAGTSIKCTIEKDENLWDVDADPNQLSQVLHNILLNARQAMDEKGKITVVLKNTTLEEGNNILPAGNYVKIDITDTGKGIDKKNLNRIFEPFYTSKDSGSGLGLYIAYSIIEKHEGHITATSEIGKGTTFTIYLKTPEKKNIQSDHADASEDTADAAKKNFIKKVLIVDDEKDIRESLSSLLKAMGYECDVASDAETALEKYKRSDGAFDLVISDVTLKTSMSGFDLAKRLKSDFPAAKIIIMTGYSESKMVNEYSTKDINGFIFKPFSKRDIEELIKNIS